MIVSVRLCLRNKDIRSTDKGLFIAEGRLTRVFGFSVWKRFDEKGFVVSKVSARRGCGCGFAPCLYLSLKFFF